MRVGLYIGYTQPADGGGYTFIMELLAALERMAGQCKHELVLCHHGCGVVVRQFPGLPAIDLKLRKRWPPDLLERIYRRVARLKAKPRGDDRIYSNEGVQFLLRLTGWGTFEHEIPYGAIVFDLAHRSWPWFPEIGSIPYWVKRQDFGELWFGRASIIYIGTKRGKHELEYYFQVPPERIRILPFPTPSFATAASGVPARPELLRNLGLPKDYLFYPAQFWAHKNHVVILEACKIVRDQTGWDLGIVFAGSDKGNCDYVRAYARRLGIENACKFLGFVEQDKLIELYKGAFCLTYSTFLGPDNIPPLEAFALGCPVIASAVPGSEEQLGDAALLFAPQNERELGHHILTLRDPVKRAQLVARGRKRTEEAPGWDDYANGLIHSMDEFAPIRRIWP